MFKRTVAAAFAAAVVATPAAGQQFTANSDIYTGTGLASSYVGTSSISDSRGYVSDGGYDAFDGFGYYTVIPTGLTLDRRVELLAGTNTYRFFDTFTNTSGAAVSGNVNFYGNLGSDGHEFIRYTNTGIVVTCDASPCSAGYDPVLALVFNNNGYGSGVITPGEFNAVFALNLAPGQSASIANFAFLARDLTDRSGDQALAITTGLQLQANPNFTGLTDAEIARTLNFNAGQIAAVPEPSTWATMLLGFGIVGGAMRRRKKPALATA